MVPTCNSAFYLASHEKKSEPREVSIFDDLLRFVYSLTYAKENEKRIVSHIAS